MEPTPEPTPARIAPPVHRIEVLQLKARTGGQSAVGEFTGPGAAVVDVFKARGQVEVAVRVVPGAPPATLRLSVVDVPADLPAGAVVLGVLAPTSPSLGLFGPGADFLTPTRRVAVLLLPNPQEA